MRVYSTKTSILERSLSTIENGSITAYHLSAANPNVIFVSTIKHQIIAWNWTLGKRVGRWKTDTPIHALTTSSIGKSAEDTVFTSDRTERGWEITAHRLRGKDDPKETELATLLKYDEPLRVLKVLNEGRVVVAISSESLLIGKLIKQSEGPLSDLKYSWREVKCPEPPQCFDVQASGGVVDIVVGGLKGCILVYQNVLQTLGLSKEKEPSNVVQQAPRTHARELHWHREGVGAVAWSLDGQYLDLSLLIKG